MAHIKNINDFNSVFPFTMDGRVEWADIDIFGHVNNAYYFQYFERVRAELFQLEGLFERQKKHRIGPILASANCKFIAPLNYPDNLKFGIGIAEIKSDGFLLKHGVYSIGMDTLAAIGDGQIVYFDYEKNQKTEIPADVLALLNKYT
jgi:acyl-CoA thioester hydrolase